MSLDAATPALVPAPSPAPPSTSSSHPMSHYKIRYASYPQDLEQLASLSVISFYDDGSMIIRWPRREQYPQHYRSFMRRLSRQKLLDPSANRLVIEDPTTGQIIAHADWERRRRSPSTTNNTTTETISSGGKRPQKWHEYMESRLISIEDKILMNRYLFPNPAADYNQIDAMRKQWGITREQYWSSPTRVEQWHLDFLCVHPDHRRKGLGRMLVQWGIDRAMEDKVICGLEASGMGRGLYEGLGFRLLGIQDVYDDEKSKGYVMMWDGCGVDKVEEEAEKAEEVGG